MERTINSLKSRDVKLSNIRISKFFDTNTIIFILMGFLLSRSLLIDSMAPLG